VTERICSRLDPNKFLWKIGGEGLGSTVKAVLAMGEQVAVEAVVAEGFSRQLRRCAKPG
jgi:hypothetical protein